MSNLPDDSSSKRTSDSDLLKRIEGATEYPLSILSILMVPLYDWAVFVRARSGYGAGIRDT